MNVKILSESPRSFGHSFLQDLVEHGIPSDASIIYRGRNVVAVTADHRHCMKSFGVPGLFKGIIYTFFRKPKAERAYTNAIKLSGLGISTPEPVGAAIIRRGGLLKESYFVCAYMDGWSELRGIEKRSDFMDLAKSLAAFTLSLHRKGVLMKDFTQGNVLFRKTGQDYDFTLIDINRMEFGVTSRKKLFTNFGSTLDTIEGMEIFAREYAAAAGEPDSTITEILKIYTRHQAALWRKRHLKERFRKKKK